MRLSNGRAVKESNATRLVLAIIEYCWAIAVVMNGNTVYHASADKYYYLLELCVVLTWLLTAAEISLRRLFVGRQQGAVAIVLLFYGCVYLAVRYNQITVTDVSCLFIFGLPIMVLLFSALHNRGLLLPLLNKVFNVVWLLAILSLYYWIFGVQLGWLRPNMSMVLNWGFFDRVQGYDGLHFAFQLDTTFFPQAYVIRNSGIFAEAPMFNLWLDMALAGELFLKPRPSKIRVLVLAVTVLTTMSVTGIVFIALCVVLYTKCEYRAMNAKRKRRVVTLGLLVLPVTVILVGYSVVLKSGTQSYQMRLTDYFAGVRLWADNPLFGGGYGNLRSLLPYMYSPEGVLGFSNSLTAVLGTGGLWMAVPFYIPLFSTVSNRVSGDKRLSCFCVCYLFLFCTTAFFVRYIAVVMVAVGVAILLHSRRKPHVTG